MRESERTKKRQIPPGVKYLTYDQVAHRAQVSRRTVQKWKYSGQLPAAVEPDERRRGNQIVRFDIDVVDNFLAGRHAS